MNCPLHRPEEMTSADPRVSLPVAIAGTVATGAGWVANDLARLDIVLRITNSTLCIILGSVALGKVLYPVAKFLWNRIRKQ